MGSTQNNRENNGFQIPSSKIVKKIVEIEDRINIKFLDKKAANLNALVGELSKEESGNNTTQ